METLAILQASKRVTRKMKQEVKWAAGVISDGNLYDVNLTDAMVDGLRTSRDCPSARAEKRRRCCPQNDFEALAHLATCNEQ